jgi:phytoene dehydrogenase-like protein
MMAQNRFDVIIIGGGHNGLTAAASLAQAGLKPLVVERRRVLGGAAATEEVFPGFQVNTGAGDVGLFRPEIIRQLQLESYGLRFLESPAQCVTLLPDGGSLTLWRDPQRAQQEIARFSSADARRYADFLAWLEAARRALRPFLLTAPPNLPGARLDELAPWFGPALGLRRLGRRRMMDLLRALPMAAEDWLAEWFELPALKASLAALGLRGARLGPKAPGTTFLLLYHALGGRAGEFVSSRFVQGGSGALSQALAAAARSHGAEIVTGLGAAQVLVREGRAVGVALEDGLEVFARAVISNADPRRTFLDLVGPQHLEVRFVRDVRLLRFQPSLARLLLTTAGLPRFRAFAAGPPEGEKAALGGHLLTACDLETLERAADAAKYGQLPSAPALDLLIPTVLDPSLAPAGKHLLSVDIAFVPAEPRQGSWEQLRLPLAEQVISLLETLAPGLRSSIENCEVITPQDYAEEYSLPDGDPYHGQMGLDQFFFMRPLPGWARYRTPLTGLYLGGSGAHPGGGVTGAPGFLAAQAVLQDLKELR